MKVGDGYTNESGIFIREVVAFEGEDVVYREFERSDGRPLSTRRVCLRSTFGRWGTRQCPPEEMAKLRRVEAPADAAWLSDFARDLLRAALETATDEQLLAEIGRRGLGSGRNLPTRAT